MLPLTLSILIPARDEADNLELLLHEITQVMDQYSCTEDIVSHNVQPLSLPTSDNGETLADRTFRRHTHDYEIIVVDDASTDATPVLLARLGQKNPRLRSIRHTHSKGQSTSVWEAAQAAKGQWLVTLDGDGQNDPADIPAMLEQARLSRVDMVAGYRIQRRDTRIKRISSRMANCVRSRLLGDNTPDTGCGIKLMRREAFLTLPYFDHMHRFLPALMLGQGRICISMAVNDRHRQHGHSHYGLNNRLWAGIIDMIGVMWLNRRSCLPLYEKPCHELQSWTPGQFMASKDRDDSPHPSRLSQMSQ